MWKDRCRGFAGLVFFNLFPTKNQEAKVWGCGLCVYFMLAGRLPWKMLRGKGLGFRVLGFSLGLGVLDLSPIRGRRVVVWGYTRIYRVEGFSDENCKGQRIVGNARFDRIFNRSVGMHDTSCCTEAFIQAIRLASSSKERISIQRSILAFVPKERSF